MRSAVALLLLGALLLPRPGAAEHLVPADTARAAVAAAAQQRQADLAAVDRLLATPQAGEQAKAVGTDTQVLRAGLARLDDAELRVLAERAAALRTDPVAGLDSDVNMLLKIFLIVAIVILVLQAVD